jgi:endoglucanase
MTNRTWIGWAALCSCAAVGGCGGTEAAESGEAAELAAVSTALEHDTSKFYVPPPSPGALQQIADLSRERKIGDAVKIAKMVSTPQAVWFTQGTPREVKRAVKRTMRRAARRHRVPILVAYNLPFRDCAQYSQGGALDTAAYQAWIDGFASGIGQREAVVILEPDGLGIIPYNHALHDLDRYEWCQPTVTDDEGNTLPAPGASPDQRYAQLRYAISSLQEHAPNASVYLDGTHSAWLGVGEAAYRIFQAGFSDGALHVQGFFLNVSNYQPTEQVAQFGTWVSMCLAAGTPGVGPDWMWNADEGRPNFDWCPSQYDPATDYTTVNFTPEFVAGVTAGIEGLMGGAEATVPFVIDTSRNGQGALDVAPYAEAPYDQPESVLKALTAGNWCNPPGRGLGLRPTAETGSELVDAYLWIKIPGESDGSCDSAGGARAWDYSAYNPWGVPESEQDRFDPLWGMVDPAAGEWFPEQALELAQNADPPLRGRRRGGRPRSR